jgi:hypothetical protein
MNHNRIANLIFLSLLLTLLLCSCATPGIKNSPSPTPNTNIVSSVPLSITLTNCTDKWTILQYETLTSLETNGKIEYPSYGDVFLRIAIDPSSKPPEQLAGFWKGTDVYLIDNKGGEYFSFYLLFAASSETDPIFIIFSVPTDHQDFTLHFLNWPPVRLDKSYSPPMPCTTIESAVPTISTISTATPTLYTVVEGDTWFSIAIQFNVSVSDLLAVNPGLSSGNLPVGTSIVIPVR